MPGVWFVERCHLFQVPPTTSLWNKWFKKIETSVYLAEGATGLGEIGLPRMALGRRIAERRAFLGMGLSYRELHLEN